jgi:hypothetical protein
MTIPYPYGKLAPHFQFLVGAALWAVAVWFFPSAEKIKNLINMRDENDDDK